MHKNSEIHVREPVEASGYYRAPGEVTLQLAKGDLFSVVGLNGVGKMAIHPLPGQPAPLRDERLAAIATGRRRDDSWSIVLLDLGTCAGAAILFAHVRPVDGSYDRQGVSDGRRSGG
jgi:hypothetical protein